MVKLSYKRTRLIKSVFETVLRSLFLLMIFGFSSAQGKNLIILEYNATPLNQILNKIENDSDYRFIYNTNNVDPKIKLSINYNGSDIRKVLDQLFEDLPITYVIRGPQVLLISKNSKRISTSRQETERQIRGRVFSLIDSIPLAGATILVKGTSQGAVSDIDGNFSFLLRSENLESEVLEVSYLGMKSQTQVVGQRFVFNFYLGEDSSMLNEVVITSSYGTKKLKEEVVGSIVSLKSEDIPVDQAAESIDKLIDGQLAGVLVENTSGVGGPVKINIRGQGSLTPLNNAVLGTSTQPLIIIDGVIISEEAPIDSSFFDGSGTFVEDLSNPLAQISPESIESISVLKDAAAVSIYGADGANGVIIITTKTGKVGKTKFGFSSQLGISDAINQIQYLSGSQYNELRNEYLRNTGASTIPYNGVDTNWFDLINNSGIFNKYNLNVSGGSEKIRFRSSINYLKIDEPQKGNGTKQLNANLNLNLSMGALDLAVALNPSYIRKDAPNIYYSYAFVPTIPVYNDNGDYSLVGVTGLANPLAAIEQNRNLTDTYGLFGSINLSYDLNASIKFSTLFGIDLKDKEQDRYFSGENESGRRNGTFNLNGETYPSWGIRTINQRNSSKWNWQGNASFNTSLNEIHTLDGLVGFELSKDKADFSYASGRGFINPNEINEVNDAIRDDDPLTSRDETFDNQTYSDDISYNSRVSFFSQLNYNYRKRYYFLGNFRRDQSSVFGDDTDVAYNGGIGLSWILSNELFLKNADWIDFLKLKVSYGTTGNSRIGSYRSKGLYTFAQNGYNGLDYATPNSNSPPNTRLSWEKNNKFNFGVEFNLLDKISITAEYYYDKLEDLITGRNLPSETGYASVQRNAASMYNKGFELALGISWIKSENITLRTNFNIATLYSKITDLSGIGTEYSLAQTALAQKVGYSTSTIWGVNWIGVDPGTGRELLEKDGQIYDAATYNNLFDSSDWIPIGDRQPDAYGGFSNTLNYKNLTFAIRGSFQIGGDFLIEDELISQYRTTSFRNLSVNAYDYWRQPGDVAQNPIVINNNPILPNSDKFLFDGTSMKISNVNLSYDVPVDFTKRLNKLSVFVDVSNVLYWYKEKSPKGRNGIREFRFNYPQARTISLGLNANF